MFKVKVLSLNLELTCMFSTFIALFVVNNVLHFLVQINVTAEQNEIKVVLLPFIMFTFWIHNTCIMYIVGFILQGN